MKNSIFLLLDLLPYEIPLIYSNNELAFFIDNNKKWQEIILSNNMKFSQPYNFTVYKNDYSKRNLSLLHPLAQLQMQKFVEKYDQEIINYFENKVMFSLRYPFEKNSLHYKKIDKMNSELAFLSEDGREVNNNNFNSHVDSYFNKNKFLKITDFYKSYTFRNLEIKYPFLYKIDISNFFNNIYTHSLDWAFIGNKEYAKENTKENRLSVLLDQTMQASNYGETNGIVVGPEFSRIVAEILLTRIDLLVFKELERKGILFKKDYEVARYIDDTFIFTKNEDDLLRIRDTFESFFSEFKLSINEAKVFKEKRPFLKQHTWVTKLKKILKNYFDLYEKDTINSFNLLRMTDYLIAEIRVLLIEFEEEKHSIVSFTLSAIEKNWGNIIIDTISNLNDDKIKKYIMSKLLDIVQYILAFSLTAPNVIKYAKITLFINKQAKKFGYTDVEELIFKKGFEIIKHNQYKNTEILNIIITMKSLKKELPEKLLLEIAKGNPNYFTLSTLAYYIDHHNRSFKYNKLRNFINIEITKVAEEMIEKYLEGNINERKLEKLITHSDFYILHDFYSSKIINKETKRKIKYIQKYLKNKSWKDPIFEILVEYLIDFNKPFMDWNASYEELAKKLIEKANYTDTRTSN